MVRVDIAGGSVVKINIPEVLRELTEAFERYEAALVSNEPQVLNELFWDDPQTVRYGIAENLYGHAAIVAYRANRAAQGGAPARDTVRAVVTTYGHDFGTTNIEYVRSASRCKG